MSEPLSQNRFCTVCRSVYPDEVKFCPKDGAPLEVPQQVLDGRFVLKERIGAGNMGTVHRAVQLPMGREVAVKLLHAEMALNPEMVARFEREALAASTVDHPNAITIYDSGKTADNQVFIAMEFLDGESLAAILRRQHRIPAERALELWLPAVKAMVVAHRKGVLHRDLKPDNIFVAKKVNEEGGSEDVIKVLDFGIAKLLEGHRGNRMAVKTVAGVRIGTAMYMAPEQLEGREASKQSDVYALGLILIELITGRMPWGRGGDEGDTMLTMLRLVNPPLPLSELCRDQVFSPELQRFFGEVLAIDPTKRPADAGELLRRMASIPEAAPLTQSAAKRSEISMMMTATAMAELGKGGDASSPAVANLAMLPVTASPARPWPGAATPLSDDENQIPATDLPSAPTRVKAGMAGDGSGKFADVQATGDDTIPRHDAPAANSGVRDLPQVATVITGNRPPTPARGQNGLKASDLQLSSSGIAQAETLPPPIKSVQQSTMATLPTGISAPHLAPPAPTVPMPVARVPQGLAARLARTLPSIRSSSATVRAEPIPLIRQPRMMLVLAGGALLLIVVAYLLLRSDPPQADPPRSLPDAATAPLPTTVPEKTTAEAVRVTTPLAADDPTPKVAPRPPAGSDEAAPTRRRGAVQVTFLHRRPTQLSIICGTPSRVCNDSCTVSAGEQCVARSPGFQAKRYSYDDLRSRSSRNRVRVEVKLTTSP